MAQNEMILHLASKGMDVPVPIKNVNGTYQSLENLGRPNVMSQQSISIYDFLISPQSVSGI